ncbi:DoxX family protein [Hyphomicrobium sp. 2TAF46]|uniref:DoxX family protein n=1 Tax=Hyphomicrobium sp. 2TAF46 TaxID=3233019 RepID=UPI003F907AF4
MVLQSLERWEPVVLSILRIVTAMLFFEHGMQKLFNLPPPPNMPVATFLSLDWFAGVLELVGGGLLVLGLFTRPVALLLSGEMAIAYWLVHAPKSFLPIVNRGDSAILFCFVFLYLVFAGGGSLSLDSKFFDKK